jgi:hypothetical protein
MVTVTAGDLRSGNAGAETAGLPGTLLVRLGNLLIDLIGARRIEEDHSLQAGIQKRNG